MSSRLSCASLCCCWLLNLTIITATKKIHTRRLATGIALLIHTSILIALDDFCVIFAKQMQQSQTDDTYIVTWFRFNHGLRYNRRPQNARLKMSAAAVSRHKCMFFLHVVCLENLKCRIIGFTLILKLQSLKKMFDHFELIYQAVKVNKNR